MLPLFQRSPQSSRYPHRTLSRFGIDLVRRAFFPIRSLPARLQLLAPGICVGIGALGRGLCQQGHLMSRPPRWSGLQSTGCFYPAPLEPHARQLPPSGQIKPRGPFGVPFSCSHFPLATGPSEPGGEIKLSISHLRRAPPIVFPATACGCPRPRPEAGGEGTERRMKERSEVVCLREMQR